jgi:hypothetical protein
MFCGTMQENPHAGKSMSPAERPQFQRYYAFTIDEGGFEDVGSIHKEYRPASESEITTLQSAHKNRHILSIDMMMEGEDSLTDYADSLTGSASRVWDLSWYGNGSEIQCSVIASASVVLLPKEVGKDYDRILFKNETGFHVLCYDGVQELEHDQKDRVKLNIPLLSEEEEWDFVYQVGAQIHNRLLSAIAEKELPLWFYMLGIGWQEESDWLQARVIENPMELIPQEDDCCFTLEMGTAATSWLSAEHVYYFSAYLSMCGTFTDFLKRAGVTEPDVKIELVEEHPDLGVAKVRDNLWIEGLLIESLYGLDEENIEDGEIEQMSLSSTSPKHVVNLLASMGIDSVAYHSYLRGDDGADVGYSFRLFNKRKPIARFFLSAFDVNAGYHFMRELKEEMGDDFELHHSGEREYDWEIKEPVPLEEDGCGIFYPEPPSCPMPAFNLSAVILGGSEVKNVGELSQLPVRSLVDFPNYVEPNGTLNGVILPPLLLPATSTDPHGFKHESAIFPDFEMIEHVIQCALEDGLSFENEEAIFERLKMECQLHVSETRSMMVGSVVIVSDMSDEFYNKILASLSMSKNGDMSDEWRQKYRDLFPGIETEHIFHIPLIKNN